MSGLLPSRGGGQRQGLALLRPLLRRSPVEPLSSLSFQRLRHAQDEEVQESETGGEEPFLLSYGGPYCGVAEMLQPWPRRGPRLARNGRSPRRRGTLRRHEALNDGAIARRYLGRPVPTSRNWPRPPAGKCVRRWRALLFLEPAHRENEGIRGCQLAYLDKLLLPIERRHSSFIRRAGECVAEPVRGDAAQLVFAETEGDGPGGTRLRACKRTWPGRPY